MNLNKKLPHSYIFICRVGDNIIIKIEAHNQFKEHVFSCPHMVMNEKETCILKEFQIQKLKLNIFVIFQKKTNKK